MSEDDQVSRAIEEIEQALRREDPSFLQTSHDLEQRPGITEVAVFSLLAASAVLLTVGLATASAVPWYLGVVAYSACFVVDRQHERHRRRTRGSAPKRQAG